MDTITWSSIERELFRWGTNLNQETRAMNHAAKVLTFAKREKIWHESIIQEALDCLVEANADRHERTKRIDELKGLILSTPAAATMGVPHKFGGEPHAHA